MATELLELERAGHAGDNPSAFLGFVILSGEPYPYANQTIQLLRRSNQMKHVGTPINMAYEPSQVTQTNFSLNRTGLLEL